MGSKYESEAVMPDEVSRDEIVRRRIRVRRVSGEMTGDFLSRAHRIADTNTKEVREEQGLAQDVPPFKLAVQATIRLTKTMRFAKITIVEYSGPAKVRRAKSRQGG